MRICLVSRELAPFFGSGIGVYAAEAARAWAAGGHEVHVLTSDHTGITEGAGRALPGVRVHAVSEVEGPGAALPEPRAAVLWPLVAYDRLWRLHEAERFEYIEFADFGGEGYFAVQGRRLLPDRPEGLPGCVLGIRLHMPSGLINHANHRTWRGRHREYVAHMERAAIAGVDVVFAPCRAVVEALRAMGAEVEDSPRRPVVVSANPFVPARLDGWHGCGLSQPGDSQSTAPEHASAAPQACHPSGAQGEIVFVGRLERRKGPDVLVRAAVTLLRERPGVRVRLIGGDTDTGPLDGSVLAWLTEMIPGDLRDRIALEGQKPRGECVATMASAAAVCFPAWWDNWPYAVLEAMSLGACVVASDSGGHAEMIEDGRTGLLVNAGDADALAAALGRVLDDGGLRSRLGEAARDAARKLSDPEVFAQETVARVEATLARRTDELQAECPQPHLDTTRPQPLKSDGAAITVVIPHKDMPDDLPEALDSLSRQTVQGFGVVVIDDGSTSPRAIAMLERLEREPSSPASPAPAFSLRVVRRSAEEAARSGVRGPAAARNLGIAAATTPLIVTLDADDALTPQHLEKCAAALAANPGLACVGTLVSYFDQSPDRPTGAWAPLGLVRDIMPAMNTMGTGSGIMFRREALSSLRPEPFDPAMPGYEDWDLYCAMAAAGLRGEVLPELLVHYRVRAGSRYHGQDRLRHDRLVAELAARYPGLAERPDVAMRMLIAEGRARQLPLKKRAAKLKRAKKRLERENRRLRDRVARLDAALDAERDGRPWLKDVGRPRPHAPLRYRAADRAAGLLRKAGLSGAARRVLRRLATGTRRRAGGSPDSRV